MVNVTVLLFFTLNVSTTLTPVLHRSFPYGKAPSTFGLKKAEEIEPVGPYSFAIGGPNNDIYIPDPVNGNIKIISSTTGDVIQTVNFSGYFDDIRVDKTGKIYILDRTGARIIEIDKSGKSLKIDKLDYEIVKNPCKLVVNQQGLFIKNLTTMYNPKTKSTGSPTYEAGIHNEHLDLFYHKPDGTIKQIAQLKINGIVSAEVLGVDKGGNLYVQIEVKKPSQGVYLKVLKFKENGTLVGNYTIPKNDYFVWTARLLDIDENGEIYQVLPGEDHIEINIWKTE